MSIYFATAVLFFLLSAVTQGANGPHQSDGNGKETQNQKAAIGYTRGEGFNAGKEGSKGKTVSAAFAEKRQTDDEVGLGGLKGHDIKNSLKINRTDYNDQLLQPTAHVKSQTMQRNDSKDKEKQSPKIADAGKPDGHEKHIHMEEPSDDTNTERVCQLQISETSLNKFKKQIVYKKANIITLKLRFSNTVNVTWSSGVILPFSWRWVYKETEPYLRMPYSSVVWSLGLLYLHSKGPIDIELDYASNMTNCRNITIGDIESDLIIGRALGNMTQCVASKDIKYNTSKWCYMRKTAYHKQPLPKDIDIQAYPTLEYVCCAYKLGTPTMEIKCFQTEEYEFVWWQVHQILGILMLLYFPILFMKMSGKLQKRIKISSTRHDARSDGRNNNYSALPTEEHVYLMEVSPVTASSLISPVLVKFLPSTQTRKSRLAIILWLVATLILPAIELLLWYLYMYDFAIALAKNNMSFGFSSMLAGWEDSRSKLSEFGGPFIALSLYVIIGGLLTLCPSKVSDQIYLGVADNNEQIKTILLLSLKNKEKLGSVKIDKTKNGYTRSYKLQLCHLYMLLNPDFWTLEWKIVTSRWSAFVSGLEQTISTKTARGPIILFCLPLYVVLVLIEISIAFSYYSVPILSFLCSVVTGYCRALQIYLSRKVSNRSLRFLIRIPLCVVVLLFQIYYLYIFTILFLQSFWFISRLLVFTYTAIVAYPRETYGYLLLIVTTVSFSVKRFFSFGNIYKLILEIAIKQCKEKESLQKYLIPKEGDDTVGISRELFENLVENIRPRRVHIFHTLLQLSLMIFILCISINIMVMFQKFEDLSLFVNVFVTMFICALPAIYSSVISSEQRKLKLKRKIDKLLYAWNENQHSDVELISFQNYQ